MPHIGMQKRHRENADEAPRPARHQAEAANSRPDENLDGEGRNNQCDQAGRENNSLAVRLRHRASRVAGRVAGWATNTSNCSARKAPRGRKMRTTRMRFIKGGISI